MLHRPNFAGNSRSSGTSQLRTGKTGAKRPVSHFLPKRRWILYVQPSHPNVSLCFRVAARRVKNFPFSRISVAACKFFWRPAVVPIFMPPTFSLKRLFFLQNLFSRQNGRLSPTACDTFLESLCISGQFRISGNNFSASQVSEFNWQIAHGFLQHLRPHHTENEVINNNITYMKNTFCHL